MLSPGVYGFSLGILTFSRLANCPGLYPISQAVTDGIGSNPHDSEQENGSVGFGSFSYLNRSIMLCS